MVDGVFTSGHYRVPEHEIEDVLSRTGLYYKRNGTQFVVKDCPFCDAKGHPIKGKSDNQWKCYFTRDSGAYFCHRCGSKGSLFEYKKATGLVIANQIADGEFKQYRVPDQSVVNQYPTNFMHLPDVFAYCTEKRKIRPETLEFYQVGASTYQFEDGQGGWIEEACITFPWVEWTQTGKQITVRVKARSIADKSHMRLEPSGGRWGWFGWHTIPREAQEIVICEGEWDAMSVYQATKDAGTPMAAISLPNGSRSLPPELLPYLERFKRVYLWMDDDVSGMEGAAQFARKLGDRRTWIVQTRMGKADGPKDANECLQRGEDIPARIDASKPIPHEQLIDLAALKAEVFREILNPEETNGTPIDILPKLGRIMKGHRRGELTILTGGTGQGKTTILGQHSLRLAERGEHVCWGSFEIKNHRLVKKMLYQFAQKTLAKYPSELDGMWEKFTQLPIWLMKFFGGTNVDQVLDAMDYAVYAYDVSFFVIDNLQFMTSNVTRGMNKFDVQDDAITKFRDFSTRRNVHTTLVIHPRKMIEGVEMDVSSIGGTPKASQEADNVWILQRGPHYRFIDVRKNRYDGESGLVPYEYDPQTHCIRELTDSELDEKKSVEVETAVSHGMVSQIGAKAGDYSAKKRARGRRSEVQAPAPGVLSAAPSKPVKNYAPGADNTAYRNAYGPGASQD